ncbi:hypothetical protein Kisp01_64860 [Kineosporia sp. NBRC 101677]|uniref:GNAT family N-acetyltransferase n=1 Tax=Kineosporia sp. NBRC 101677 TaxID=3032197 RepID=UPI0024A28AD7|nr:GNAT family N-acetyltransferase [Kineosporia sp. NBRC 101677]GLY19472.1 hypothetical protein Kisp01_64860 [Kineosporia sp. NBRC 101677]
MTSVQDGVPGAQLTHPLDNPAWASLAGPHSSFAVQPLGERARRYQPDISPFNALRDPRDPQAWQELAALAAPDRTVFVCEIPELPEFLPPGWEVVQPFYGVQMVATGALIATPDPEAVRLGPADVDDMLALVARSEPGPFERRTVELGNYYGLRREGRLVAMAGERMNPPGYREISAVTTDPDYRRRGFAARLVRTVAHGIIERGETPLLHADSTNAGAVRLYESLGFAIRRRPTFFVLRVPEPA